LMRFLHKVTEFSDINSFTMEFFGMQKKWIRHEI